VQAVEVGGEPHLLRPDVAQVAGLDHGQDVALVNDLVEDRVKTAAITAVRGGGDAHHQRAARLERAKRRQNRFVRVSHRVVGLVHDDSFEPTEPRQPLWPAHGLNATVVENSTSSRSALTMPTGRSGLTNCIFATACRTSSSR
jgi:hypothetical protein